MPDVREVYEMVTKQKPPEFGALERQQKRQVRAARNKRIGAYVVAAAIVLAAAVPILVNRTGEDATTPAGEPTVGPAQTREEEVATGFLEAYGAFDADRAITYLADDADISGLMLGPERVEGTRAELRLNLAMLEAQGHVQRLDPCEVTASLSSGTKRVRCAFDFHFLGSDEIGLGPYGGSRYDLSVLDGEIVRAEVHWEIAEFSPQMWEPFADWVSTTHPDDAAVMYTDATYSIPPLSEESIRLWKRHTREYVGVVLTDAVGIAERFMEARNDYDSETAMSLVSEDGARAVLLNNNRMDPDMFSVPLSRDELALAFEAERIYGVRYENFECSEDPGRGSANVICTYSMDSKLRQLAGLPPVESAFRLRSVEGRIDRLSFPWLNVSGNPGGFYPAEFEPFVRWLEVEHPEAGGPLGDGELFRTAGQELILILTPESLDLLAGYLEEYERSVNG